MKKIYIQPSIQVLMLSEATSVMYDTSVPFGGDLEDDVKKHTWGASFELWDDYSNEQAGSDTWE